jgi:hypothetical protein
MQSSSSSDTPVRAEANLETTPPTLDVIDDIQGVRVQLSIDQACHLTRCSTEGFLFPVDTAYELSAMTLWTHQRNTIIVRDTDGNVHTEITNQGTTTLSRDTYIVDLCSLGVKVYLVVQGTVTIQTDEKRGQIIDCSDAERVRLGLRSFHESPAATVTTTDQPRDIMRALSCLGSSLKTTSCERSFPSLRGHPPLLERGERFHAPSGLERTAETASVRIEVPPTLETIYPIAPLAYYLNAMVQPGDSPRLVAGDITYDLNESEDIETWAARLLTHIFTLDCITRTEGFYPITLGERETLEQRLAAAGRDDIDFDKVYEYSMDRQIQRYLSIPFETVEDLTPRWPLTAEVLPVPLHLSYLPFVVATLGTVRCLPTNCPRSPSTVSPTVEAFCRNASANAAQAGLTRGPTASSAQHAQTHTSTQTRAPDGSPGIATDIHSPPETDSITQLWLTDGYPIQGAKPTLDACQRRLDANPTDTIDVAVINNDPEMQAESVVADLYGLRDRIDFDVTIHEELSRSSVRDVFSSDHDLVHYVGHVDEKGLQCDDEWLDAQTLDAVSSRAFVLNGCRSHEQGMALVEAGAIGGLCTLTNVSNTAATEIGQTVARLLNAGFSLGSALDIINDDSVTGQQYMVVGDPGLAIVKSLNDIPTLAEIKPESDNDMFSMDIYGYSSSWTPIGMPHAPSIGDNDTYYLNSGHNTTLTVTRAELVEYLQRKQIPIRIDGSLRWSDSITVDTIER